MTKLSTEYIDELLARNNLRRVGPYLGAGKPLACECLTCGRAVAPRASTIQSGHSGCKYCSATARARSTRIEESLAVEVMAAAGVQPLESYKSLATRWLCLCLSCGEQVTPQFANVRAGHKACKYCAGKAITKERAINIYLGSGAKPVEEFPGVNEPWHGVCLSCTSPVQPRLSDLQRGQGACRTCGYEKAGKSQKLTSEYAYARMREAGVEPLEDWESKRGVEDPWLAECQKCHRLVSPTLHSITSGQGACLFCGRDSASLKKRLSADEAISSMLTAGFEPLAQYPGAAEPWDCRCLKCGSEKPRRLANIKSGYGCQECAYQSAKIPADAAIEAMRARGFEPIGPYVGSSEKWLCRCNKCGLESFKRLYSLNSETQKGCTHCSVRELGSIVYLVESRDLRSYKVGVGKLRRIQDHVSRAWVLHRTWDLESPSMAYKLESEVLRYIREIWGLPSFLGKPEMPQGGHTETFSADEISAEKITHLIQKLMPSTNDPKNGPQN